MQSVIENCVRHSSPFSAAISGVALDSDTPGGLFQSEQGDRYLVVYGKRKIAIVLKDWGLPSLTWIELTHHPVTFGCSTGMVELLVGEVAGTGPTKMRLGEADAGQFSLKLLCRSLTGVPSWITLGQLNVPDFPDLLDGPKVLLADNRVIFERPLGPGNRLGSMCLIF